MNGGDVVCAVCAEMDCLCCATCADCLIDYRSVWKYRDSLYYFSVYECSFYLGSEWYIVTGNRRKPAIVLAV